MRNVSGPSRRVAPPDPEIGGERAADDERPEQDSRSRNPRERADPHDSSFVRSVRLLAAFGLGYLLGTVQSADIVSRIATGGRVNLRTSGSRNPGAVNAGRVLGPTAGRAVMVADVAKAYAGCAGGRAIAGDLGAHVGGVAAVVGHCYPAWNDFDGGKGLATSFGQCLYTFPVAAPVDLGLAIGVARIPGLPSSRARLDRDRVERLAAHEPRVVASAAAELVGAEADGRALRRELRHGGRRCLALRRRAPARRPGRAGAADLTRVALCTDSSSLISPAAAAALDVERRSRSGRARRQSVRGVGRRLLRPDAREGAAATTSQPSPAAVHRRVRETSERPARRASCRSTSTAACPE